MVEKLKRKGESSKELESKNPVGQFVEDLAKLKLIKELESLKLGNVATHMRPTHVPLNLSYDDFLNLPNLLRGSLSGDSTEVFKDLAKLDDGQIELYQQGVSETFFSNLTKYGLNWDGWFYKDIFRNIAREMATRILGKSKNHEGESNELEDYEAVHAYLTDLIYAEFGQAELLVKDRKYVGTNDKVLFALVRTILEQLHDDKGVGVHKKNIYIGELPTDLIGEFLNVLRESSHSVWKRMRRALSGKWEAGKKVEQALEIYIQQTDYELLFTMEVMTGAPVKAPSEVGQETAKYIRTKEKLLFLRQLLEPSSLSSVEVALGDLFVEISANLAHIHGVEKKLSELLLKLYFMMDMPDNLRHHLNGMAERFFIEVSSSNSEDGNKALRQEVDKMKAKVLELLEQEKEEKVSTYRASWEEIKQILVNYPGMTLEVLMNSLQQFARVKRLGTDGEMEDFEAFLQAQQIQNDT